jgi:hypothetical protein
VASDLIPALPGLPAHGTGEPRPFGPLTVNIN